MPIIPATRRISQGFLTWGSAWATKTLSQSKTKEHTKTHPFLPRWGINVTFFGGYIPQVVLSDFWVLGLWASATTPNFWCNSYQIYVCVLVYTGACLCRGQRKTLGVLIYDSPPYCLDVGSLIPYLPPYWDYKLVWPCLGFDMEAGDPNSSPHTCLASTLIHLAFAPNPRSLMSSSNSAANNCPIELLKQIHKLFTVDCPLIRGLIK